MSYDFRKVYQVAKESGCDISSDTSEEAIKARLQKVKDWIDKNFSDVFETGEATGTTTACLIVYFKGTNCGMYVESYINANSIYNHHGYVTDTDRKLSTAGGSNAGHLHDNTLRLLMIKSKYGFITGFFRENISDNIKALVINMKDRFVTMIYNSPTQLYIAEGPSNVLTSNVIKCSLADVVCLSKLYPPGLDCVPEGIYQSVCLSSDNCIEFSVGDKKEKYVELPGSANYITFALKLEEPSEADYSGIKTHRGGS